MAASSDYPNLMGDLDVIYLIAMNQFCGYRLNEGYNLSIFAGQWTQEDKEIKLAGVAETLMSDCQPYDRFAPFKRIYVVNHNSNPLTLEISGEGLDGSPWKRTFAPGRKRCIVPVSRMCRTEFFPIRYEDLPRWAASIRNRVAEGHFYIN
jgi:hypothetical protein